MFTVCNEVLGERVSSDAREAMLQGFMSYECVFLNETLSRINPHYVPRELSAKQSTSNPDMESALDGFYRFGQTSSSYRQSRAFSPQSSCSFS